MMRLFLFFLLMVKGVVAQEPAGVSPEELKANEMEQEARKGVPAAMGELGRIYLDGRGRPKSMEMSKEWFTKGAAAGNPVAQVGLGYMLSRGLGGKLDYVTAGFWFQKAADQNDVKGQHNLARLLFDGRLGAGRKPEALQWFIKAAEQGYVESQAVLGSKYYFLQDGFGQDYDKAVLWLEKAAAQGHRTSRTTLATTLRHGQGKPAAPSRAIQLYEKSVSEGDSNAMCLLGDMLAEAGAPWRDPVRSFALFTAGGKLGIEAGKSRAAALEAGLTAEEKSKAEALIKGFLSSAR